ncbi:MAG: DUF927 domain-containing protein [Negativicutes bacterium]|nr:DUF927 domain-containing protein [Negativicutes bacterium]
MNADIKKYFETMYKDLEAGYVSIWDLPTRQTKFHKVGDWDALLEDVQNRIRLKRDVYFGVCLLSHQVESGRGKEEDIGAITALFADIDLASGNHNTGRNYPETVEKAMELLTPFPKPSVLVHSGGGLHAYWLLDKPVIINNDEDRVLAKKLVSGFQNALIKEFAERGYEMDNTGDLARILRVPETLNLKDPSNPKEVKIISDLEDIPRYAIEQFPQCEETVGGKTGGNEVGTEGLIEGDVNVVVRRCPFIQHCIKEANNLKEPLWHAAIDNIALVKDVDDFIHEMSRPHSKYSADETNEKISHAREKPTPHTCRFIQGEKIGFRGCPPGGCPVEAPIGWLSRKGKACDLVLGLLEQEKPTKTDLWNESVQDALAEIKCSSDADYHNLLYRIKEKVPNFGINDFKKVIAEKQKQKMQQSPELNNQVITSLSKELGYPVTMPTGYHFDEQGQVHNSTKAELVAFQPIGIASQFVNRNGEMFDELVFQKQRAAANFSRILVQPHILASMNRILDLANLGVLVDSSKSSQLVSFLTRFKKANAENIKTVPFTSRLGWQDDGSFFPGLSAHRFISEGGMVDETDSYHPQGSVEEWMMLAEPAKQNPGARLALAASFAAPLLKMVPCRTYILHLWGPTQGGKTAAQVLAASVWMNPEKAMVSFNSTKVGLEKHLSHFANVPVVIDERQIMGDNQALLDMLIYMMAEEQGKTRGTRTGGIKRGDRWRTIVMTSGEHPLSAQSSAGGTNTRALEPYFTQVIQDTQYAAHLHGACAKTFGTAGPAFLRQVLDNQQALMDNIAYWTKFLRDQNLNPAHINFLATLAAADCLSSIFLWQKEEDEAWAETTKFLDSWIAALQVTEKTGELHRVRAFVEGWLVQCQRHFSETWVQGLGEPGVLGDRYGWYLNDGNVGIVPNAFQKALQNNGFHWDRVKIDFANEGWLKTVQDRGSISYTVPKTIPGQGTVRLVELIGFRAEEKQKEDTQLNEIMPKTFEYQNDGEFLR